jgi:outer membrane protein assembly factor BamB
MRILLLALAVALAAPAGAQSAPRFADLAGWWAADPMHGGESSHVALQLVEQNGKPKARLSLVAIGAYDIDLGEVTISGNSLDTKPLSFPLAWDADAQVLRGRLPADAAPVYDIPVEFRRGPALVKPAAVEWRAPRPVQRWSVATGAPVWAGLERDAASGLLFAGNDAGRVSTIGPEGRVRWTFETGGAIRAQPRVLGARVHVSSDSGYLHALESATGREAWRARIGADLPRRIPTSEAESRWDHYGSSVVADSARLYVASRDRNLYALDRETGREIWRVAAGDIMTATPALWRDLVIFAAFDGKVRAVAARDGAPRWTYDARLAVPGDVVVDEDRVLVGSRTYDLVALEAASGRELWKRYYWFSWIESPAVVRDGSIYTGSSDATAIYTRDRSGTLRWKTAVPGWPWPRVAVDGDWLVAGTVGAGKYLGARTGALVALDRGTGAVRWIHPGAPDPAAAAAATWGFGAAPLIADGVVYAAGLDGNVSAFSLRETRPRASRRRTSPGAASRRRRARPSSCCGRPSCP